MQTLNPKPQTRTPRLSSLVRGWGWNRRIGGGRLVRFRHSGKHGISVKSACYLRLRLTDSPPMLSRIVTITPGKLRVFAGNYFYDYLMVFLWFRDFSRLRFWYASGYDFNTATRESTARKAARLQVRKPYQNPSEHIKTSPGGGWRRIEIVLKSYQNRNEIVSKSCQNRIKIVSKPYPTRKPYQNRNRKDPWNHI